MQKSTSLKVFGAAALTLLVIGCNPPAADETQPGPDTAPQSELSSGRAPAPLEGQAAGPDGAALAGVDNPNEPAADGSNPILVADAGGSAPYLTNRAGSALYFLEGDTDGGKCAEVCTDVWPPFLIGGNAPRPTATAGLAGELGSVERPDGSTQVTFNEHPLYRYAADVGDGRTSGQDVSDKWGQWHLISPQGDAVQGQVGDGGASGETPRHAPAPE